MSRYSLPQISIAIGFGTTGLLLAILLVLVISRMEVIYIAMEDIVAKHNVKISIVTSMRETINKRQITLRNIYILSDFFARDEERLKFYGLAQEFVEARNALAKLLTDDTEKALFDSISKMASDAYPLQNELIEMAMSEAPIATIEPLLNETLAAQYLVMKKLNNMLKYQHITSANAVASANITYHRARLLVIVLGGISIVLVLLIAIYVGVRTQMQTRKIRELAKVPAENPSPVLRIKIDGTILYVNNAGKVFLDHWGCQVGEQVPEEWKCIIANLVESKQTAEFDIKCLDKIYAITFSKCVEEGYVNFYGKDITEREIMKKEIAYQASHDALTGLINRREFEYRLSNLVTTAISENKEHAILYMDLDQFKVVNDTGGHVAGDRLLKQISNLMKRKIRSSDTLARLGGDEFAVLLDSCNHFKAQQIANQIRHTVKDFRFLWDGKSFKIGVSIGLVVVTAETTEVAELLTAADTACYIAKESGRNRVYTYVKNDQNIQEKQGEIQWIQRINQAFEQDLFTLFFQQIKAIGKDQANGLHGQIQLRMVDEDGKLISPRAFIPTAERYNMMQAIDRWVIENTLSTLSMFHLQDNYEPISCALNLSGQSIGCEEFLDFLVKIIKESGIAPESLCFEITETAAIANVDSALRLIDTLKSMNCRFALDDFGSGLSSFNYLKSLNVDYLKIDGNIVKDLAKDPVNRSIFDAINKVAHEMEIKTIAAQVESDKILRVVSELGVDYGQGLYLDKPKRVTAHPFRHKITTKYL